MNPGYLALETRTDKPGLVRLLMSEENPREATLPEPAKIRFVLHFDDVQTAYMNAQSNLSHHMVDVNHKLFKRDLATAIGDLETIELKHTPVWRDPDLSKQEVAEIAHEIKHNQQLLKMRDRFITVVKWVVITLLVVNLFSPLFSEWLNHAK